ncbi:MAG: glutamine synthetase, partial [Pseudomonadota bacterium]|nr:glutamine synthetase [Pseudomonadota bacterium]
EASLAPQTGVRAADNAILFKTYTKALAQRMGRLITFMARWNNDVDGQSGAMSTSRSRTSPAGRCSATRPLKTA